MINFTQLVLGSHNAGKLKELQAMLGESVQLRSIGEFSSCLLYTSDAADE